MPSLRRASGAVLPEVLSLPGWHQFATKRLEWYLRHRIGVHAVGETLEVVRESAHLDAGLDTGSTRKRTGKSECSTSKQPLESLTGSSGGPSSE